MKTEIKEGKIIIDIVKILQEVKGKDKLRLVEALSCEDEVIKNVADQICFGCTEEGWHGGRSTSGKSNTPLDKAIEQVAKSASEVSKQYINELQSALSRERKKSSNGWKKYHELQDSLRTRGLYERP